jgi:hypothetical protein
MKTIVWYFSGLYKIARGWNKNSKLVKELFFIHVSSMIMANSAACAKL